MKKADLRHLALGYLGDDGSFPAPRTEYRFHSQRRFRFDLAWPEDKIAVECEGGVYSHGRHVRPKGFLSDVEKYNLAAVHGWKVLRFTREMIEGGVMIATLEEAFYPDLFLD